MGSYFIHPSAEVLTQHIGQNTRIWQHVTILHGAVIGEDVNICTQCFVENKVFIGNRVTIKSGVYLWDGVHIEDDVFIGPNVTFTNDKFPRSRRTPEKILETKVRKGASIGAGAIILPGLEIGAYAMVSEGALVTQSVPPNAIVMGSPARITGYVEEVGGDSAPVMPHAVETEPTEKVTSIGIGKVTLHQLKKVQDIRGDLAVGEFPDEVPFVPKRFFFVYNVPSLETRGQHAHFMCEQFLICVKGSCAVVVDDGKHRKEIQLTAPDLGLYIPPMIWGIQYKYSEDAVLMVFASDRYDASDYIRDYQEFIKLSHPG